MMQPRDPNYKQAIQEIFDQAGFVQDLGIRLKACGPGWCETELAVTNRHEQHDGYIHAGVQAAMGDHTAGAAAGTLMAAGQMVLTAEFKVNLLRPAKGESLFCRAEVLKPGKTLTVVESEVYALTGGEQKLASKMTATIAIVALHGSRAP
jgi:uncharacterized protein (TIGR00369 family)